MILDELSKKGLITPPPFVISNTHYLVITGSVAYGVADTSVKSKPSDQDCYGFCMPPKNYLFKHLQGVIPGFGDQGQSFDEYMQHHIFDNDAHGGHGQEYDLTIFNIVKFFELCRQGNPNMIDVLFVPENCIKIATRVGMLVRDNRKLFVSKLVWPRFRGYAWQQMHKAESVMNSDEIKEIRAFEESNNIPQSTRRQDVVNELQNRGSVNSLAELEQHVLVNYLQLFESGLAVSGRFEDRKVRGQDSKFLYHLVRLLDEAEQLLETGEMNVQRAKEAMKAVRRGEWSLKDVQEWAMEKEKSLSVIRDKCLLPKEPDEKALKTLLMQCFEEHYGNLSAVFQQPDWALDTLTKIDGLLNSCRGKLYS